MSGICTHCGNPLWPDAAFCAVCGQRIIVPQATLHASAPDTASAPASAALPPLTAAQREQGRKKQDERAQAAASSQSAAQPAAEPPTAPGKLILSLVSVAVLSIVALTIAWLYLLNRGPRHPPVALSLTPLLAEGKRVAAADAAPVPPAPTIAASSTAQTDHAMPAAAAAPTKARLPKHTRPATPKAKPDTAVHTDTTPAAVMPAAPQKSARTIDQVFKDRSSSECGQGLGGLICREGIRLKLCKGHWSATPPAGRKSCYVSEDAPPG